MFKLSNLPNLLCIGLIAALMIWAAVMPAKSEEYVLLGKHELKHDWHLTLVGKPGGPVGSCGIQSPFESPGTDLVPKGAKVTLMIISDDQDHKDHFDLVILSPSWNLPEGFTTIVKFTWNSLETDKTVYRLDATRWPSGNGIMMGVTREFVDDFAKNKTIEFSAMNGQKEIGSFPLIGSMYATTVLKQCEETLNRVGASNFGNYLKDRL